MVKKNALNRVIVFMELSLAIFLPWRLRCKFSELLNRLEVAQIKGVIKKGTKKERDFDMFFHLARYYANQGKMELAFENLKKALEISPNSNKAKDVYEFILKCSKTSEVL